MGRSTIKFSALNDGVLSGATLNQATLELGITNDLPNVTVDLSGLTTQPSLPINSIQFNDAGSFKGFSGFTFLSNIEGITLPSGTRAERTVFPGIPSTIRFNTDWSVVEINTGLRNDDSGYERIGSPFIMIVENAYIYGGGVQEYTYGMNYTQTGNTVANWELLYVARDDTNNFNHSTKMSAVFFNNKTTNTSTQIGTTQVEYNITDDAIEPTIVEILVNGGSGAVRLSQVNGTARDYNYYYKLTITFTKMRTEL